MMVDGNLIQGGQNIFFAQLASPDVVHFSADATRYFSGEFIFMILRPSGRRAGNVQTGKAGTQKDGGRPASLGCADLYADGYYGADRVFIPLCGAGAVCSPGYSGRFCVYDRPYPEYSSGTDFFGRFSGSLLFGILQGNAKTSWLRIIPAGIIYFLLYYFIFSFLIKRFNLKTPGREDSGEGTKLYTKADVNEKKNAGQKTQSKGREFGT